MVVQGLIRTVRLGAFAADEPWPDLTPHYELERRLGVRLPIMSWFQNWTGGWPRDQAAQASASGHDLQIALEPVLDDGRAVSFGDVLAGRWDDWLDEYFQCAAGFSGQVTIRLAHEMNVSGFPWSVLHPQACTADLDTWLATWRHVVDRQRAIGGDVRWMWCLDIEDQGSVPAESYWPGTEYVDVLGIDVYNGYGPWTPPLELLSPSYQRITALHPSAPVWLAEVGCRPAGPGETVSKAQWYLDLFATTALPRVGALLFFNSNKEHDWRITTGDLQAVREQLADSLRE